MEVVEPGPHASTNTIAHVSANTSAHVSTQKKCNRFRLGLLMTIALLVSAGFIVARFVVNLDLFDEETSSSTTKSTKPASSDRNITELSGDREAYVGKAADHSTSQLGDGDGCYYLHCFNAGKVYHNALKSTVYDKAVCKDLYDSSCGGWIRDTSLPPHSFLTIHHDVAETIQERIIELLEDPWNRIKGFESSAIKMLKKTYRTCMDTPKIQSKGIDLLKEVVGMQSGWTVTTEDVASDPEQCPIEDHLGFLISYGVDALFVMFYHKPENFTSHYILFQPARGTYKYPHLYEHENAEKAYMKCAKITGELMEGNWRNIKKKMEDVWKFEKKVAGITGEKSGWKKYTIQEFQNLLGNWITIIEIIKVVINNKEHSMDDVILVTDPSYFQKLGNVVAETSKETLQNFFVWRMIMSVTEYLPPSFYVAKNEMKDIDESHTITTDMKQRCRDYVEKFMGLALVGLYRGEHFARETHDRVKTMINELMDHFIENLDDLVWLDATTRSRLREKAEAMRVIVGFPYLILYVDQLDELYQPLSTELDDNHLFNYMDLQLFNKDLVNSYIHAKKDELIMWSQHSPFEVNVFYHPQDNTIVVPMGYLHTYINIIGFPDAMLYGKLGMEIGRELIHAFDSLGRKYDKDGLLKEQWSKQTADAFMRNSTCFIQQYSRFSKHGKKENGTRTLTENIADNGGLRLAYKAWRSRVDSGIATKWKLPSLIESSDEQLFFISVAQNWCFKGTPAYFEESVGNTAYAAAEFRVNGMAENSREFFDAFECDFYIYPPENRCTTW